METVLNKQEVMTMIMRMKVEGANEQGTGCTWTNGVSLNGFSDCSGGINYTVSHILRSTAVAAVIEGAEAIKWPYEQAPEKAVHRQGDCSLEFSKLVLMYVYMCVCVSLCVYVWEVSIHPAALLHPISYAHNGFIPLL